MSFPRAYEPNDFKNLVLLVADSSTSIPLQVPPLQPDDLLRFNLTMRFGPVRSLRIMNDEESRERYRYKQWLTDFGEFRYNARLLSLVQPEPSSKEHLREILRSSIVVDQNRKTYFSMLDDLVKTTLDSDEQAVQELFSTHIAAFPGSREQALRREYDRIYLSAFVQPTPAAYTSPRVLK